MSDTNDETPGEEVAEGATRRSAKRRGATGARKKKRGDGDWRGPGGQPAGTKHVDPEAGWGKFSDAWARGVRSRVELSKICGASVRTVQRYVERAINGGKKLEPTQVTGKIREELGPAPPKEWDAIEVAARAAHTEGVELGKRLQAVRILEERRRWEAEHGEQARVDWATVKLDDIPHEHRARLAGLLAETLVEERAPQLGLAETTEAQATAYYLIGQVLTSEEAEEVVGRILAPALAAGVARAKELIEARQQRQAGDGPRDSEVRAEDWLTHV